MTASRPRVIIAHETEALRESALRVVREAGYEGVAVADGESALALIASPPHPAALVVDVALPKLMGYELIGEIQARGLPVKSVLIASVYSKTAYKRRPSRLYGADDYIEQHHLPDKLAEKLARLVPTPVRPPRRDIHDWAQLTPEEQEEAEHIRRAGEARLDFGDVPREDAIARARRVARVIVADLILYSGVEPSGKDVQAGRELFARRVPAWVAEERDFVGQALAELQAAMSGET